MIFKINLYSKKINQKKINLLNMVNLNKKQIKRNNKYETKINN